MKKKVYSIIGASAAGIAAAKKIRSLDKEGVILCFSAESEFPYNKCFLVDWISEEKNNAEILLENQNFFDEQRIQILCNTKIVALNKEQKYLTTEAGEKYFYDYLLLATGACARPLESALSNGLQGIISFYTAADTQKIKDLLKLDRVQNVVIIGGGISGVECADAIRLYGKKVILLERGSHILKKQVMSSAAEYIQKKATDHGIDIRTNTVIHSITSENEWVTGIQCSDDVFIPADLIITTLGSHVDLSLATMSNLGSEQNAITTNKYLQTTDPFIFAAGDCALVYDLEHDSFVRSTMWPDAVAQGIVAGTNMVSCTREYKGIVSITISHFFGGNFVSCGLESSNNQAYKIEENNTEDHYSYIVYDENFVVKGFVLFGLNVSYTALKRSFLTKTPYIKPK